MNAESSAKSTDRLPRFQAGLVIASGYWMGSRDCCVSCGQGENKMAVGLLTHSIKKLEVSSNESRAQRCAKGTSCS